MIKPVLIIHPLHPYMTDYYSKAADEVLAELDSSGQGLTNEEAEIRLSKYGENRLPEKKKKTRIKLFLEQFKNYLIFILLIAAAIVYLPQVQGVFGTVPLSLWDWLLSAATASIIFIAFEIYKAARRNHQSSPPK